jgi:superfamily I DNA and RNA helicase
VVVESIRRFKGLERPVVVLIELEAVLKEAERLYVGLTRARLHLVVLGRAGTLAELTGTAEREPER